MVYGNAEISGDTYVGENAKVGGNSHVDGGAMIYENAWVGENARVYGDAKVGENSEVCGDARVYGNAEVYGNAKVYGNAEVYEHAKVHGNARVGGDAEVLGFLDILVLGSLGGCGRTITATWSKDNCVKIAAGCFFGTIDEFKKAVIKKYGEGESDYLLIIPLLRKKEKEWSKKYKN